MKCAFCLCACTILIVTGSVLPVAAGDLTPPAESGERSQEVRAVDAFNHLLNTGDLDRAESMARDCFLKDSSDPLAVLMMRQILLTRKDHSGQFVFPVSTQKCRIVIPPSGVGKVAEGTKSSEAGTGLQPASAPVPSSLTSSIASEKLREALRSNAASNKSVGSLKWTFDFHVQGPVNQALQQTCTGSCLEPINSVRLAIPALATHGLPSGVYELRTLPLQNSETPGDPFSPRYFFRDDVQFFPAADNSVADLPRGSDNGENFESTINLYLIKGPREALDRFGIGIQGETTRQISQPQLNAAKAALPTPITVPILTPAAEEKADRADAPLAPFSTSGPVLVETGLTMEACQHRRRVIRKYDEPLATRYLSSEERQEILKAAQAAERISITQLPKVTLTKGQDADLSSSVIDSEGKPLELKIHLQPAVDQRATTLQLTFHSDLGPAALRQTIMISELVESDEGLLIALDEPAGSTVEKQTSYLIVTPHIQKGESAKFAKSGRQNRDVFDGKPVHGVRKTKVKTVAAERTIENDFDSQFVVKTYSVADLVTPIPDLLKVDLAADIPSSTRTPTVFSADFEPLTRKIFDRTGKDVWDANGGRGTIHHDEKTLSLVVRHSEAVHRQIQGLLTELRQHQDVQVVFEWQAITGSRKSLEKAGLSVTAQDGLLTAAELKSREAAFSGTPCSNVDLPHANCQDACPVAGALDFVLEKTQSIHPCLALLHKMGAMDIDTKCVSSVPVSRAVFPDVKLLTTAQKQYLVRAVCADKSTNVLSAPKVTLFQGQTADMLFGAGRNFQVSGKVSQTKQVFVTLGFGDSDSAGSSRPFSGILNDGESVLFPAPSGCCSDSLCESCDAEFYIVTPRILILHDEEECKPVH